MKKLSRLIGLVLLGTILLTGCSSQKDEVEDLVRGFLEEMKKFNLEEMGTYLAEGEDGSFFEEEGLEDDSLTRAFMEYFKENAGRIEYEIGDIEIDQDQARVKVKIDYIDGEEVFRKTMADLMDEAFSMDFSDEDLVDEEMEEAAARFLDQHRKAEEEKFTEKTIDFELIRLEDGWAIDQVGQDLLDVFSSNLISLLAELDGGMGELSGGEAGFEAGTLLEKDLGEEVELTGMKLLVTTVEETDQIVNQEGKETGAGEGRKFVVLGLNVVNTSGEAFSLSNEFYLIDSEGRRVNGYPGEEDAISDSLAGRKLEPGLEETGFLVFEVEEEADGYSVFMEKKDGDKVYEVILR